MATASASTGGFTLNSYTVADNSNFASSEILSIPEQLLGRPIIINGVVGAGGALAALTITASAQHGSGGTHCDYVVNPDGTTSNIVLFATTNSYITGAGNTFLIHLTSAPPELIFKAKKVSGNTTLVISGTVLGGAQPRS